MTTTLADPDDDRPPIFAERIAAADLADNIAVEMDVRGCETFGELLNLWREDRGGAVDE